MMRTCGNTAHRRRRTRLLGDLPQVPMYPRCTFLSENPPGRALRTKLMLPLLLRGTAKYFCYYVYSVHSFFFAHCLWAPPPTEFRPLFPEHFSISESWFAYLYCCLSCYSRSLFFPFFVLHVTHPNRSATVDHSTRFGTSRAPVPSSTPFQGLATSPELPHCASWQPAHRTDDATNPPDRAGDLGRIVDEPSDFACNPVCAALVKGAQE